MWKSILKPKTWVAKLLLLLVVLGFFALGISGYLSPVQSFLDSDALSFQLGANRYSIYLLTRAAIIIVLLFWLAGIVADFGEQHILNLNKIKI